ncbi:MAG: class I SAM-dependent methyltransferase [Acidimicrobiia bacterium]|nr:MAG: class I SAM-dependent methyltransferase [Acidimicrobiia bacterium]
MTDEHADRIRRLTDMEGSHFWSVGRDVLVKRLIERHRMAPLFVDAGSGTGAFARSLADAGMDVVWFDTGPIEKPGFQASITAMPLRSGSAGTVISRDVLEHVDDQAALGECARVVRRGGHLLVTVPGWPSLWGPRDELAGHLRRYRWPQLIGAVERAGFDVVERRGYQLALLPLFMASRAVARFRPGGQLAAEEGVHGMLGRVLTAVNVTEAKLAGKAWIRPPTGSTLSVVAVRR